jgi:hypothetical protein
VTVWTILALTALVVIAVGGLFGFLSETDLSSTLESARRAIEDARDFKFKVDEFESSRQRLILNKEIRRGLQMYNSMDVMRGAIEQSLDIPNVTAAQIIQTCLRAASTSLLVAFDFEMGETWTICVYQARRGEESGKVILECIAHERTIQCDLSQARKWEEGVGAAGIAYSTGNELFIPDLASSALGAIFKLRDAPARHGALRPYDEKRYRSIAVVPIVVGASEIPWGVAVATSDQVGHFSVTPADGVATYEPVRAIAAMAALAVKAVEVRSAVARESNPTSVARGASDGRTADMVLTKSSPEHGTQPTKPGSTL